MSRGVAFTAEEVDLMYGLPLIAQCLYFAIRLRMDYKTGKVGVRPEVSWHAFAEALYTEPGPGMRGGNASDQAVRRASRWLVKAGLIQMQSNEAQRKLIFFLPLSKRDFFPSKKADSKPTDQPDRPRYRGKYPEADRGHHPKADTHRDSDMYIHHHGSALGENPVDNLVVSPSLRECEMELKNLLRLAPRLNGLGQAALDELAHAQQKGAIRRGAVPYFVGILRKIELGTFTATINGKGTTGAQGTRTTPPATPEQGRASPERARAAIAAAQAALKGMA